MRSLNPLRNDRGANTGTVSLPATVGKQAAHEATTRALQGSLSVAVGRQVKHEVS